MAPYFLLFLLPVLMSLTTSSVTGLRQDRTRILRFDMIWMLVFLVLTMSIGLRIEVGGDWDSYLRYLYRAETMSISELSLRDDPAYWLLNILSNQFGLGVTGVNTAGAIIFSTGLIVFCRSMPRPWLALACAMPYLVTVVAMGYTRQGIAVGLLMIGFVALGRQKLLWFIFYVLAGALFHKTAVVLLPLAALVFSRNRVLSFILILMVFGASYVLVLQASVEQMVDAYVDENMVSSGAMIRLAMNAMPAVLFLYFRKRFIISDIDRKFFSLLSMVSLFMFAAFFVTNISTALDRLALYMIPLQLVLFSHLPDALGRPSGRNVVIVLGIMSYYFAVLFVWLNFATHARFWLPYQMGWAGS